MLWVKGDPPNDRLYIQFLKDRLIVRHEWFTENATIDLGIDDAPVGVTIHCYSQGTKWPFTEDNVKKFSLTAWMDDLVTVRDAYFRPDTKLVVENPQTR